MKSFTCIFLFSILPFISAVFHKAGFEKNRHLNATMNVLLPLLRSASYIAERSQPAMPDGKSIFDTQGHIYDVIDEVKYYVNLMTLPNISVVCETGFNAGHSAITFLAANPHM